MSNELPLLGGIAATLRWFEELLALLSGPLLVIGLGISLTDLLTDGQLLAHQPLLLYAWATSQAIGVDAGLVGAWDKARTSLRERRYWALTGLVLLGTALAYVGWIAAQVFAVQQSQGVSTAVALSQLGMDDTAWLIQRSLLSVLLVCLSGWNRYHPTKATLEQEKAALRREADLLPLRQQVRRQKALGAVSLAKTVLTGRADEPPTEETTEADATEAPARVRGGTPLSVEDRIRRALTRNPALSGAELARIVGCSKSQALRIRRKLVGEKLMRLARFALASDRWKDSEMERFEQLESVGGLVTLAAAARKLGTTAGAVRWRVLRNRLPMFRLEGSSVDLVRLEDVQAVVKDEGGASE